MIEYMVRVTCDECGSAEVFSCSADAIKRGWSITNNSGGWLCPTDSRAAARAWSAALTEPSDEDLLA